MIRAHPLIALTISTLLLCLPVVSLSAVSPHSNLTADISDCCGWLCPGCGNLKPVEGDETPRWITAAMQPGNVAADTKGRGLTHVAG